MNNFTDGFFMVTLIWFNLYVLYSIFKKGYEEKKRRISLLMETET